MVSATYRIKPLIPPAAMVELSWAHWCSGSWQDGFPPPGNLAGSVSSVLLNLQHSSLWGCSLHVSLCAFSSWMHLFWCVYTAVQILLMTWLLTSDRAVLDFMGCVMSSSSIQFSSPKSIRCNKAPVTLCRKSQPMLWWWLDPDSTVKVALCFRRTRL